MDRTALLERLRAAVDVPWVRAAWLGGSDATGRTDAWSDIDLSLLVPEDRGDEAFALVEACLAAAGGIAASLHIPEPAWHGHRQRFYQVRGLPESAMVDLCVMRRDRLDPFLDPSRHGQPLIWFDRDGVVVPVVDTAIGERLAARRASLRARAPIFAHLPAKALARGHRLEALDTWFRFLLVPLVELLRAQHCPERQDFGLRYLDRDLPPDVRLRLEALIEAPLEARIGASRAWLEEVLAAGPGSSAPRMR